MLTPSDMTGKVSVVTGAGGGLGRVVALRLAQLGSSLCLVDINADTLQETAVAVRAQGAQAVVRAIDLAVPDLCRETIADTAETFGRLDALCNVAAVFLPQHTTEMTAADWEKTIAVNLSAPFFLAQAAIPHLLKENGAIVNVTSCAAFIGQAYCAAYCATKAGLTHMTKSMAMEYINQPIRINAVAPGGMATAMGAGMMRLQETATALISRFVAHRGVNEVEDVAEMVVFLATDAARGYHGACINVDNGITAG